MDHINILKKLWRVLWSYRNLWYFGSIQAFFVALMLAFSSTVQLPMNLMTFMETPGLLESIFPPNVISYLHNLVRGLNLENTGTLLTLYLKMSLFIIVFSLGAQILHIIADIAMVRMVDQWDASREKISFREAFRLGWSKKVWRIILIYLTFILQVFFILLFVIILITIIFIPFSAAVDGKGAFSIVSLFILLGFGLIGFVALMVFGILVNAAVPLMIRSCVLDDLGVIDSVDRGFKLCRNQLKDVGIMALLNYAVTIVWSIFVVLFRFFFSAIGLVLGVGVFWLLGQMTGLFNAGAEPGALILPLVVGGLLYLITTAVPYTLAYAFQFVFQSSLWTLTYRQLPAPEKPQAVTEAVHPEV